MLRGRAQAKMPRPGAATDGRGEGAARREVLGRAWPAVQGQRIGAVTEHHGSMAASLPLVMFELDLEPG